MAHGASDGSEVMRRCYSAIH